MNLVPKSANPPNCLELRVIEKYLAIIKQKMKKKQQTLQEHQRFENIMKKNIK